MSLDVAKFDCGLVGLNYIVLGVLGYYNKYLRGITVNLKVLRGKVFKDRE